MEKLQKAIPFAVLILLLLALTACAGNTSGTTPSDSASPAASQASEATPTVEETPAPAEPKDIELTFATNFHIIYLNDGMKIVTDGEGKQFILLHDGQTAPAEYSDLAAITIPLKRTIYTSTTQVGFLRAFEDDTLYDSIVGVRMAAEDWDFDAMKNRMLDGKIVDIGSNTSQTVSYDFEIIQSINPEEIFLSGGGMGLDIDSIKTMLEQMGVPCISDGSSKETDYRGTMEWIKFFATFYDLDQEAKAYFDAAMARIDGVMDKVKDAEQPTVGWAIVSMGSVYVEDAGSKSAKMIRAAGAIYAFDGIGDDTNSVTSISVEELYDRLSTADYMINRGMPKYGPDLKSITDQAPMLADLAIFRDGNVWQITDDFWSTYHTIDQKYIELAAIFHPDLFPDVEFENFILMPQVAE